VALPVLLGRHGAPAFDLAQDLVFLDLETTGLAGGAGTFAFLVGCAWFEGDRFRVQQFLMAGHALERAQLAAVRARLMEVGILVTYNGRSFDVPVLETRYLYHRDTPPLGDSPHLDMLHVARRLWRYARPSVQAGTGGSSIVAPVPVQTDSCTLGSLEQALFAVRRRVDVPGFEIPTRYFRFLRTGDARPLEAVLEHNRLDLVSLAALTARALRLVSTPECAEGPRESYGLGLTFERAGALDLAEACYRRTVSLSEHSWHEDDQRVRGEALRALAVRCRRSRRYQEAASCWEAIITLQRCTETLRREALEALAIHYEHRSKDLDRAVGFARRLSQGRTHLGAAHRLARLSRKIEGQNVGPRTGSLWQ
jgi:uncharacterized protein YprB with RNaseH-like and TPR domain